MKAKRVFSVSILLSLLLMSSIAALFVVQSNAGTNADSGNLQFREDGTFKIIQFTDFQDKGNGNPGAPDTMYTKTKQYVQAVLRQEKPDLVVLTGDNVYGSFTNTTSALNIIRDMMRMFQFHNVPVAMVFGNHDAEGTSNATKQQMLNAFNEFPNSLTWDNGDSSSGRGNFNLLIKSSTNAAKNAFNLWFFDGNTARSGNSEVASATWTWYQNTAASLKTANGGTVVPAIAFKHSVPSDIAGAATAANGGNGYLGTNIANWSNYNSTNANYCGTNSPSKELNYMDEKPCPATTTPQGEIRRYGTTVGDVRAVFFGHEHFNHFRVRHNGIDMVNCMNSAYYEIEVNSYWPPAGAPAARNKPNVDNIVGCRVITLNENLANTTPDDIVTRTITGAEIKAVQSGGVYPPYESAHSLPAVWTTEIPATCLADGTELRKCTNIGCDYEETRTIDFNPANHTGGAATCKDQAACGLCGAAYGPLDPENHGTYGTHTGVKTPATCDAAGLNAGYCDGCDAWISDGAAIPRLDHTGGAATCKDQAACGLCGAAYGPLDPENHVGEKENANIKPATCIAAGSKDIKCLGCGEIAQSGVALAKDPSSHMGGTYEARITTETCTLAGSKGIYCRDCDALTRTDAIAATGRHTPNIPAATCKTAKICIACGITLEAKNAKNHAGGTYEGVITAATCGKAGSKGTYCKDCDALTRTDAIAATGRHTPNIPAATCKTAKICTACGTTLEAKNAKNHAGGTYERVITAAACNTAGSKGTYCKDCDALTRTDAIAATDHSYGAWKVVTAPASKTAGEEKRECSLCGAAQTREIPKTSQITLDTKGLVDASGAILLKYRNSVTLKANQTVTFSIQSGKHIKLEQMDGTSAKVTSNSRFLWKSNTAVIKVDNGSESAMYTVKIQPTFVQYVVFILLFGWIWY